MANKFTIFCALFISFVLFQGIARADSIKRYDIEATINAPDKKLSATVDIVLDTSAQKTTNLTFLLNKNAQIRSIAVGKKSLPYTFDVAAPAPNRFVRAGRLLTVDVSSVKASKFIIRFQYDCVFDEILSSANSFDENWIELGGYSAWFPYNDEERSFTHKVNVAINKEFNVSGSGIVTRSKNGWQIVQNQKSNDIVLLASKNLQTQFLQQNDLTIRLDYIDFENEKAVALATTAKEFLGYYEKWFGASAGKYLTFAINPTKNVTSYSRIGFISFQVKGMTDEELNLQIGHELGHLWWRNATTATWEDWLNESFAEYAAILAMREKYGADYAAQRIEKYRQDTKDVPPVYGLSRDSQYSGLALYRKGPVILFDFGKSVGEKVFLNLLKVTSEKKIKDTATFLKLVETRISVQAREELEKLLRS